MKHLRLYFTFLGVAFVCFLHASQLTADSNTKSIYSVAFDDPDVIDLATEPQFAVSSGEDITATLQAAIDHVADNGVFGVILIPSGEYSISDTVFVWKGIRLIGYGPNRPKLILPDNCAGFAEGEPKYLFHYAHNKPKSGESFRDATPGTFYSAFSNIDVDLGNGNTRAVAIRSKWAQHSYVSHVRFEIRDALAAVQKVGNIIHDCEFIGGQYGIMTTKPSPSWPFALLDSAFTGQKIASIISEEAGLTVVRCNFKATPVAVKVREQRSEELIMEFCHFEAISDSLVHISEPNNARSQANLINCTAESAPVIATFSDAGAPVLAPQTEIYQIEHFLRGLYLSNDTPMPKIQTRLNVHRLTSLPPMVRSPERTLSESRTWVNLLDLGARGDGVFDNTEVFKKAIEDHDSLFLPTGIYRVSQPLSLKSDTCIVGLSPIITQIRLNDGESAFADPGQPKAVIESSRGGSNILQGIGIDAGGNNPGAVALKWMASEESVVNDVRLIGGHGSFDKDGNYLKFYNNNRSADSDTSRRWGAMPASIWVTENGGGTFKNIWTPSPFAHAGMLIENTSTPGYTYQISSEHHVRNEFVLRNVQNWKFYVSQFEEEMWEGRKTLPLQIHDCSNLSFNNTYVYRVMRTFTPFSHGIEVKHSKNIKFYGIHAYGPSKFTVDDTVRILDTDTGIRSREITLLEIEDSTTFDVGTDGQSYELLASGFNHIDSPELDSKGNLYFVDEGNQKIWKWDTLNEDLQLIIDTHLEPSQIVLEDDHSLIILSRTGKVYRKDLRVSAYYDGLERIDPIQGSATEIEKVVIPATRWRDEHNFLEAAIEEKPYHYALEGADIPAEANYPNARLYSTWFRTLDLPRTYDLLTVSPGETTVVSDEFSQKTWSFSVQPNGTLTNPKLLAEEGEAGVIRDPETGKVYISAGHIFVYNSNGELEKTLTPPSRPGALQIAKSADGSKYLYILARDRLLKTSVDTNLRLNDNT